MRQSCTNGTVCHGQLSLSPCETLCLGSCDAYFFFALRSIVQDKKQAGYERAKSVASPCLAAPFIRQGLTVCHRRMVKSCVRDVMVHCAGKSEYHYGTSCQLWMDPPRPPTTTESPAMRLHEPSVLCRPLLLSPALAVLSMAYPGMRRAPGVGFAPVSCRTGRRAPRPLRSTEAASRVHQLRAWPRVAPCQCGNGRVLPKYITSVCARSVVCCPGCVIASLCLLYRRSARSGRQLFSGGRQIPCIRRPSHIIPRRRLHPTPLLRHSPAFPPSPRLPPGSLPPARRLAPQRRCAQRMGSANVLTLLLSKELVYTNARDLSYSEVACVTVLTWDVLIMISEEVDLIWRRAWTPAKMMYLVARYLPWLVQLALLSINVNGSTGLQFTPGQCAAWQVVQGILLQVIVTTVDVILITRVYALYSRSRPLLSVLASLFLAELTFLCYVLAVVTPRLTYDDECYVTSSPAIFQYYWIVSLVFETVLFSLTMYRFCDAVRQGWGKGPVLQQFVTDGTWAYALIFLVMLINMMLYKYVHSTLTGICYTWLLVVLSFAGSRLVLNPRRAYLSREAAQHSALGSSPSIELTRFSGLARAARGRTPGVLVTIEHISDATVRSTAGDSGFASGWEEKRDEVDGEGRRSGSTMGEDSGCAV